MTATQLVIFDCDGVLVDSEPVANRTLAQMLRELGLDLTQEQIFQNFVGYSLPHCMRVIEGMLGHAPPATFLRDLQARTFAAFRSELRAMPGIEHALDRLSVPFCVASSGDHEKMRLTLGITGLFPRFDGRIFSVTQVTRGKPAPDVYLFAAGQLGAEPAACVVVEDTPPGVQAGVAAGMTVFGYCAHTPEQKLKAAGAHLTFDDMHELPQLLSSHRVSRSGAV
jgi:HAD superfamily hydrolase (TIGR01509 family)